MKLKSKAVAVLTAAAVATGGGIAGAAIASPGDPVVYICPATQSGQDPQCAGSQEFEIFDTYGNPVYSVGEYGGDAVFGDNRSVYAPGNVFRPALVESYESPVKYTGKTACGNGPETWFEPASVWTCTLGVWVAHPY